MISTVKKLLIKYQELISYVFFGGLTTLVNIVVYWLCADVLHIHYLISNALAWISAVLFAYVTNRTWVFKSKKRGTSAIFKEFSLFVSGRILSGLGDMLIMFICVSLLTLPGLIAKIASNVFVVIFNYVFSKLIIFRKSPDERKKCNNKK